MAAKRIFITGGASGFGRALAERYAREGYRVAIGDIHDARGEETLASLRKLGATAHYLKCDVTKEADFVSARDWLESEWGGVDIVVNNAGVAVSGGIADVPLADWEWIIDINLLGVVRGCRVFTPLFRNQGSGTFVNTASMAGLLHPPLMSAYCATKAAVVAISETLRTELAGDNIHVSVVCPSFFRTNLMDTARNSGDESSAKAGRKLVNDSRITADQIAELAFRGIERGELVIVTHKDGRAGWLLKRLAPASVYEKAMAKMSQRMMSR